MAAPLQRPPKFYFELDGLRYGARNLTISEKAACLAKIEQLTSGKYKEWAKEEDLQGVALGIQVAVYLNVVICQWPTGMDPINFLDCDDDDVAGRYWESYVRGSEDFRTGGVSKGAGQGVGGTEPTPEMVPGSIPPVATR